MHDKRVEALTSFQKGSQSYPSEPFNQIPSPKINVVIFPWEGVEVVVCNIEEKERGSCSFLTEESPVFLSLIVDLQEAGYIADKKLSRFVLQKQ